MRPRVGVMRPPVAAQAQAEAGACHREVVSCVPQWQRKATRPPSGDAPPSTSTESRALAVMVAGGARRLPDRVSNAFSAACAQIAARCDIVWFAEACRLREIHASSLEGVQERRRVAMVEGG